jgi:hypothetical protein
VRTRTRKWNRVIDFASNPCDAPLSTWFQTFRPAAGKAVITLLSFGIDDVARGYFRPKGIYPRGCLGRKRRGRSAVGIPELGEEIGKRLPAAEGIKSRSFGTVEKYLWLGDGIAQRVLFWLMVADIVTDFTYDWATGIYREGFCSTAARSNLQASKTTYQSQDTEPPKWVLGNPGTVEYQRNAAFFADYPPQLFTTRPARATLAWTIQNNSGVAGVVTLRLIGAEEGDVAEQVLAIAAGGTASGTVFSTRPGRAFNGQFGFTSHPANFKATLDAFNVVGVR